MYIFVPRLSKSSNMMLNMLELHCLKLVLRCMVKKDFVRKKRRGGKLDPKWVGPYIITAKLSKGFYSLQSVANSSDCIKRVMFYSSEYQSSCSNSPNHFNQSSPHHWSVLTSSLWSVLTSSLWLVLTSSHWSVLTSAFQSVFTLSIRMLKYA